MSMQINLQKEGKDDKHITLLTLKDNDFVRDFFTQRGFIDNITHEINQINAFILVKELKDLLNLKGINSEDKKMLQHTYDKINETLKKKVNKNDVLFYHCIYNA